MQSYLIKAPVSDGDFISQAISQLFERFYISITFFSDEYITPLTPTAGTAIVTATDDGFNYGTMQNGTIDVSVVEYDRPYMSGRARKIKVNLSDVAGATHFAVTINSYN